MKGLETKTQTLAALGLLSVRGPRNITRIESGKAKVHTQVFPTPTLQRYFTETHIGHLVTTFSTAFFRCSVNDGCSPDRTSFLNHRNNQSPTDGKPLKLQSWLLSASWFFF